MPRRADVAVIGLGAAGSSAVLALARRGLSVIGVDRFTPPHAFGSSHGRSRVIREAYYESPVYVPLVQRAYELWSRLEQESGRRLLRTTGGLMLGPADGTLVPGARQSAEAHHLPFEALSREEVGRRFPVLVPGENDVGIFEPRAGILDAEGCVEATLALAARAGAEFWYQTVMTGWRGQNQGLAVATTRGVIECGSMILAAGAWNAEVPGGVGIPLVVERQVMFWFEPTSLPEQFFADRLPVFIWEWTKGRFFYGIPDQGAGFKVARHHEGRTVSAESIDRAVSTHETADVRHLLRRTIPLADGPLRDAMTCLYTNTPDHHFAIGAHPAESRLLVASACSGHGFKFASVIGEVLADLATGERPTFDLSPFRLDRFK